MYKNWQYSFLFFHKLQTKELGESEKILKIHDLLKS